MSNNSCAAMEAPVTAKQPPSTTNTGSRVTLSVATPPDRETIYRLRHRVYASELGQHTENAEGRLTDALDAWNVYLVAKSRNKIVGFISITPPRQPAYSIDKYVSRSELPFPFDNQLYELRLLTVCSEHRGRELALLLMYAAFRWVEAHGGTRIMAIGRREILEMYFKGALKPVGQAIRSGKVMYDVLEAPVTAIRERAREYSGLLQRIESRTDWQLTIPFQRPATCFHGGAFFEAVGEDFATLERYQEIINADVLDAWFPPAPEVVTILKEHLPWLLRTSPPTCCSGLVQAIARARGVRPENILPGGGSSDLIFRAFNRWLNRRSHVLILDPTYGEYAHVLEKVVGCTVDRLVLSPAENYDVNLARLKAALTDNYDLVVLVNPNSPTGRHIPRQQLEEILALAPMSTRIWVDETYAEYAGAGQSLETFATSSENVIVCKSMSKVYALSGARVAYLCAGPQQLEELRAITPPWVVSLPAQVAAVKALQCAAYYQERYQETAVLRAELAAGLEQLGLPVVPGVINALLVQVPADRPTAAELVKRCREQNLFLRDASGMGTRLGTQTLRIAVKDRKTNQRMLAILRMVLRN